MKNIFIPGLLILSMSVFFVFNFSKNSKLRSESSKNTKNDYVEKLKIQIEEWDFELEKLEIVKLKTLDGDVKVNADKLISSIRSQRDELKMNIEEIQNSTDNGWEELKKGAEDTKDKIIRAFSKARSEFK